MSDIYFQCDCGTLLAADKTGMGRQVVCPHCSKQVAVPPPAFQFACVQCGKEILASEKTAGGAIACLACNTRYTVPREEALGDVVPFECPHCKQPMDAPPDMAGEHIECPQCRRTLTIAPAGHDGKNPDPPPVSDDRAGLPAKDDRPAAVAPEPKPAPTPQPTPPPTVQPTPTSTEQPTAQSAGTAAPKLKPKPSLMLKLKTKATFKPTVTHMPKPKSPRTPEPASTPRPAIQGATLPSGPDDDKKNAATSLPDVPPQPMVAAPKRGKFFAGKELFWIGGLVFIVIVCIVGVLVGLRWRHSKSAQSGSSIRDATQGAAGAAPTESMRSGIATNDLESAPTHSGPPLVYSTLHEAVRQGDLADVQRHLERGTDANDRDINGKTPLMHTQEMDMFNALIEKGADVNAKDTSGKTPLMHTHNLDMIKALLAKGADVNAQDARGMTALMMDVELAIIAGRAQADLDSNYVDELVFLLSQGADVNAKDNEGMTPLMQVLEFDEHPSQLLMIKFLTDHGADVNATDKDGTTALMKAKAYKNRSVAKFLTHHGAKP